MSYSDEVMADAPGFYWRCDETSGTTAVDSSGNGRNGAYAGSYTLNQPGLLAGDSSTSVKWGASASSRVTVPYGAWMDSAAFTYECLFKLESLPPAHQVLADRYYSGNAQFQWMVSPNGAMYAQTFDGSFWSPLYMANGVVQAGVPYHAAFSWSSGTASLWLVNLNTGVVTTASGPTVKNPVGTPDLRFGSNGTNRLYGWLDEVAFYPSVQSEARLQARADAAMGLAGGGGGGEAVQWWDGADLQGADTLGWWDGTAVQPVTLLGWWDGTAVQPVT